MPTREKIREGIQRLWCQHCKSLQKTNETIVECWYNPLDAERKDAFCAANEDAVDAILKDQSNKGVVIKVELSDWLMEGQAGYIAEDRAKRFDIEPLIENENKNHQNL